MHYLKKLLILGLTLNLATLPAIANQPDANAGKKSESLNPETKKRFRMVAGALKIAAGMAVLVGSRALINHTESLTKSAFFDIKPSLEKTKTSLDYLSETFLMGALFCMWGVGGILVVDGIGDWGLMAIDITNGIADYVFTAIDHAKAKDKTDKPMEPITEPAHSH